MKSFSLMATFSSLMLGLSVTPGLRAGSFTVTGPLKVARSGHTATLLGNGKVLVAGDNSANYSSSELFNPATGTWELTGPMNVGRGSHTATLLNNGKVLVVGGRGVGNVRVSVAELYDPVSGTWANTTPMNYLNRDSRSATLLPDGKVLVSGGLGSSDVLANSELYDSATGLWTTNTLMTAPRGGHTATLLANGKVLMTGGRTFNAPYYSTLASAEIYDPIVKTWTSNSVMSSTRQDHKAILMNNGKVLVIGNGTSELYTPTTGSWANTAPVTSGLNKFDGCPPVLLQDGKVFIEGGRYFNISIGEAFYTTSRIFDPATEMWTTNGPLNTARYQHTATVLADGRVLVAGGINSAGTLTSAEIFSPDTGGGTIILTDVNKPASGAFRFRFSGTTGATYSVLTATNLSAPAANWAVLGDVTESPAGQFQFIDPHAQPGLQRFYRVRSP